MKKQIKVSVSTLCADFTHLSDEIKKCEDSGVDMLHIDVMDGHFVPVITMGPFVVEAIRPLTKLPIDAHLMIQHPEMHIDQFIHAGADIISLHVECYGALRPASQGLNAFPKEVDSIDVESIRADIGKIKKAGKKAFVVLNPGTPVCIEKIIREIDGVLVMSVNPGFAKQKFIAGILPKIETLRTMFEGDIAIDGGMNKETIPLAIKAGANIIATASYFFGAPDKKEAVRYIKSLA